MRNKVALIGVVAGFLGATPSFAVSNPVREFESAMMLAQFAGVDLNRVSTDSPAMERLKGIAERVLSAMPNDTSEVIRQIPIRLIETTSFYPSPAAIGRETIFVFSRWLTLSDDELAFILAHEMAHAALDHFHQTSTKYVWSSIIVPILTNWYLGFFHEFWKLSKSGKLFHVLTWIPLWSAMQVFRTLVVRSDERKNELEADAFACSIIKRAGFDPRKALGFMERIAPHTNSSVTTIEKLFAPHPSESERLSILKSLNCA